MKRNRRNQKNMNLLPLVVGLFILVLTGGVILIALWGKGLTGYSPEFEESTTSLSVQQGTTQSTENLKGAEKTMNAFVSAMQERRYEDMYSCLSSESLVEISVEDFSMRYQKILDGIGAENISYVIHSVEEISKKESVIFFQMNMDSQAGAISFINQISFLRDPDNEFKMVWDTTCIFPQLKKDYEVRVRVMKSDRGSILDRNNILLAGRGEVYTVGFVPGKMNADPAADIAVVADLLSVSVNTINSKLAESYVGPDTFVPIQSISLDQSETIIQLSQINGIQTNIEEIRIYPFGSSAAHLTGYMQIASADDLEADDIKGKGYTETSIIGKAGLERLYEEQLSGTAGCDIYITDTVGNRVTTLAYKEVVNGENITLTIDANLQQKLFDLMGNESGCSTAINPKTGEILALVSTPSYNPNEFVSGMDTDAWNALSTNSQKPMYNRFRSSYVPGSTFKPITGAIGLTIGVLSRDEDLGYSGTGWQKDASWGGYFVTTLETYYGFANLRNAYIYSDNIYFAKAALRIGQQRMEENLDKMGFGEPMPFEINLTASTYESEKNALSKEELLADTGYGQGHLLMNPVHFSMIYSAFSNSGNMLKPKLFYEENVVPETWLADVFSSSAAAIIKEEMIQVIENTDALGNKGKIDGVLLAGKTGTAEIKANQEEETGTEIGWFAAFTADENAENPIQIMTLIENVKDRGGSLVAVPRVRDGIAFYLGLTSQE